MSVCATTEDDSASEEAGPPLRAIYEQKAVSKVVRVLTVLAYLLSVSLAAILLSVYYICVWKSPELLANDTQISARFSEDPPSLNSSASQFYSGRSNTTVNATMRGAPSSEVAIDVFSSTRPPDPDTNHTSSEEESYNYTTPISLYNETDAT